jgi:hypothetical protein
VAAHQGTEAQEFCSNALSLIEATKLDAGNAAIRSFFADTYSDLGQAEAMLSANEPLVSEERRNHWQAARGRYVRSLEIWRDLKQRKILAGSDRGKEEGVLRKIALCDAALR